MSEICVVSVCGRVCVMSARWLLDISWIRIHGLLAVCYDGAGCW